MLKSLNLVVDLLSGNLEPKQNLFDLLSIIDVLTFIPCRMLPRGWRTALPWYNSISIKPLVFGMQAAISGIIMSSTEDRSYFCLPIYYGKAMQGGWSMCMRVHVL